MTGTANFPLVTGAATPISRNAFVRVGKSCNGNGLHNDDAEPQKRRDDFANRNASRTLSHSETVSAPRWYGPRLAAPFVAQILGQVLAHDTPDTLAARAAYQGTAGVPSGILLDQRF
jgi:hypothetical protein